MTGKYFWQEHRTGDERKELYAQLRKAGARVDEARQWRDMQPYKLRQKIKCVLEPNACNRDTRNAVKKLMKLRSVRGRAKA